MGLMEEIKFYIKDEEEANATYSRMAKDADDAGMHDTARILRGMAADELRHKEMLEGMYYKPEFGPMRGSRVHGVGQTRVRRQGDWLYVTAGSTEVRGRLEPTGNIQIEQVSPSYDLDEFQKAVDTIEQMLTGTSIPPKKSYGDWVSLAENIKEKYPDDPVMRASVNYQLQVVASEEEVTPVVEEKEVEEAKRWLTRRAGELGIS